MIITNKLVNKSLVLSAGASVVIALGGCGGSGGKTYDIAPIFPLSSDKCATYGGDEEGSGLTASCMVTKDECERAAADWKSAMETSGVNDAINFSCD